MAHVRQPKLRRKSATGIYFVRWGGKDHSLGSDLAVATALFEDPSSTHPASLVAWRRWAASRTATSRAVDRLHVTVAELAAAFLGALTHRPDTREYYRKHLARFLQVHGRQRVMPLLTPQPERGIFQAPLIPILRAFQSDLTPLLEPKTNRHDIGAVQRLFNWAAEEGLAPAVSWLGIKKPRAQPASPEVLTPEGLRLLIRAVTHAHPNLGAWMAVQYLTGARASDMPRIVAAAAALREGRQAPARYEPVFDPSTQRWHDRALLRLLVHKMAHRGQERLVLLSPEALEYLDAAHPQWSRLDSYSRAARAFGASPGPQIFRDCAASHLRAQGVALDNVRAVLGHAAPGVLRSYVLEAWSVLARSAAGLTLRSGARSGRG